MSTGPVSAVVPDGPPGMGWGLTTKGVPTVDDMVDLARLAARLRAAREEVEARRAVLGRYALVWWEGMAADRYRELVDERRAALARTADELGRLAEDVDALLVAARLDAAS
ncbi:hypothetical protein JQN72_11890 [Phycicoccus sp. CSK15P-2]|uniref:hypothetical protein n=1 Tax=Phycicoccus sp. CSK15P-2 TaxID=2807627 RepID=UPI00195231A2|nr:hypothetical protein [Phycicoccus sp. CSK15P-2]MBM6404943.1 hypothetical protein [Phycicoccus sp. CSK15P-2]